MTEQEYREIGTRIIQVFPELGEWFAALPDAATKATQRDLRKSLLIALDASDVAEAVTELAKLPTPPWLEYGRQSKGFAFIAERAREISGRRRNREDADRLCRDGRRKRTAEASVVDGRIRGGQISEDLIEARKNGQCRTAAEARAWIYERLGGADDMRDAVRCTACQDTGCVTVVSTLRKYSHGWAWTTAAASCPCRAGESFRNRPDRALNLPQYDDCEHVRLVPMATEEDVRAEVRRVLDRREQKGRVKAFDEFNEAKRKEGDG